MTPGDVAMTVDPWSRTEDTSTRTIWLGQAALFLWVIRSPTGKSWGSSFGAGYVGEGATRPTLAEGKARRTRERAEADAEELADAWLRRALRALGTMRATDGAR